MNTCILKWTKREQPWRLITDYAGDNFFILPLDCGYVEKTQQIVFNSMGPQDVVARGQQGVVAGCLVISANRRHVSALLLVDGAVVGPCFHKLVALIEQVTALVGSFHFIADRVC